MIATFKIHAAWAHVCKWKLHQSVNFLCAGAMHATVQWWRTREVNYPIAQRRNVNFRSMVEVVQMRERKHFESPIKQPASDCLFYGAPVPCNQLFPFSPSPVTRY